MSRLNRFFSALAPSQSGLPFSRKHFQRRGYHRKAIRRRQLAQQLEKRFLLAGDVFINEFHYDNGGADVGEFIEVAGPAGTDLTGWTIELYNQGVLYSTDPILSLSGIIDDEGGSGFGALSFARAGIQNGVSDGFALIDDQGVVQELISYEGTFTASGGTANGMTSVDVGVVESSATTAGLSLQKTGIGATGDDFTWMSPAAESPGDINAGQTFDTSIGPSLPEYYINEVLFDPPGDDSSATDEEYIELRGPAGGTIASDTYFVVLEGDSSTGSPNGVGDVTDIIDLSGLMFGSNGYLV
ncbi:MAG: hypothetical protein AAF745_05095, partial [Planctomycetota bacterium]